jgi:hypothetical protein
VSIALCSAENGHCGKLDQKYMESLDMLYWRRMENISWIDSVRNEEVLNRVKEERNSLHRRKRRKNNWIGHILRRKCLLKQVIGGQIERRMEVARRRSIRRKQLLDDVKEKIR